MFLSPQAIWVTLKRLCARSVFVSGGVGAWEHRRRQCHVQRLCPELQYPSTAVNVSSLPLFSPLFSKGFALFLLNTCCLLSSSSFRLLTKSTRLTMTRNAVWALSNLCRGKSPPPDFEKVCLVHSSLLITSLETQLFINQNVIRGSASMSVCSSLSVLMWFTGGGASSQSCVCQLAFHNPNSRVLDRMFNYRSDLNRIKSVLNKTRPIQTFRFYMYISAVVSSQGFLCFLQLCWSFH